MASVLILRTPPNNILWISLGAASLLKRLQLQPEWHNSATPPLPDPFRHLRRVERPLLANPHEYDFIGILKRDGAVVKGGDQAEVVEERHSLD